MTSFTKGPWKRDKRGECLVGSNGNEVVIYNSGLVGGNKTTESVANAHLIAAAPDMYELLDNIRILCEWGYNEIELADEILIKLDEIKDQLKKARGD